MTTNRGDPAGNISVEMIEQLAASGGICPDCGGVHLTRIEVAIHAVNAARENGIALPTCRCDCPTCRPFREAVRAVLSAARSSASWSGE